MAVKIRLTRVGKRGKPSYRLVVTNSGAKRDGRIIELLGNYDPRKVTSKLDIDKDRVSYWLSKGAQPTLTVSQLLKKQARGV